MNTRYVIWWEDDGATVNVATTTDEEQAKTISNELAKTKWETGYYNDNHLPDVTGLPLERKTYDDDLARAKLEGAK